MSWNKLLNKTILFIGGAHSLDADKDFNFHTFL